MKASPNIDYLIIGAGLAGSTLAWRLDSLKYSYKIFNAPNLSSASQVAAGFINPVTGKWMTQSREIDTLMPVAKAFYQEIEQALGIHIYQDLPIRRYFINEDDLIRARRRIKNPRYANYFESILEKDAEANAIIDTFGSVGIRQGSWVNVPMLIQNLKNFFKAKGRLIEEAFDVIQLEAKQTHWNYRGLRVNNIIFCQGIHALSNPFFKDLGIIPIKGDVLDLRLDAIQLPLGLYYKKRWLHSIKCDADAGGSGNGRLYRLGATYDLGNTNTEPCSKARNELIQTLKAMLGPELDFKIQEHRSGIRPTTQDTKPLFIKHPIYPSLLAINGLGSKGSATAPFLAEQFVDQMRKTSA